MELDLETFLTTLYVIVDDLYQSCVRPQMPPCGRPTPELSDSEVLCLGLAAQWRSGVPWKSERGCLRYLRKHGRSLFPKLTSQSAFNRRLRRLWGAFLLIEEAVAEQLVTPDDYEILDGVPVPVARGARSFHPGWLAEIARRGKGGNDRYFYGVRLLLSVSASGVACGWTLSAGNVQERWLAELLLSARAGCPQLSGPPEVQAGRSRVKPPSDWVGPTQSCGKTRGRPIVSDQGFAGEEWWRHWEADYQATVVTKPTGGSAELGRWFASIRQMVETAFAHLCESFGLKYPGAHTKWGLITRVAAKLAAYNLGIRINRDLGRPDFSFGTLIV
jgi:hypothetical protein